MTRVRRRKHKFYLLSVACCLLLSWLTINVASPVYPTSAQTASSIDNLRQQQQQIEQEHQNVAKERQRLSNIETAANQYLNGLQQNIKSTGNQIKSNEYQLQVATQRLGALEADLDAKERSYQGYQTATIARLRFLQRSPVTQGWAVLLQSQNFTDFLDRRRQLKLVYQADQQILAKLTQVANRLFQQKTEVEVQKNQITLIRQQLLAQQTGFETQSQYQQQVIQRLKTDRLALEAAEAQLARDSESVGQLIQQRVAEQQAREAAQATVVRGTGQFIYPCDAPITSGFGWRIHPILGYQKFHSGIDFGAEYGSTIRAADSGTVIYAGWYGGYGNAVIVNHGNGITTLYGHTSQMYVAEGQVVQRGQAIAAVGSTGLSTGPHLHFEVRQNGEPVDPLNYL